MNQFLKNLQPYPFEKMRSLFADTQPDLSKSAIAMSIGEPTHPSPDFVLRVIADNLDKLASYPATIGMIQLRTAIANWLQKRFQLNSIDPVSQVLPVNGTREALFAFAGTNPQEKHVCQPFWYRIALSRVVSPHWYWAQETETSEN